MPRERHITNCSIGITPNKLLLGGKAKVPGIDDATFQQQANAAKENCPVSQALKSVEIELKAKLAS